MPQPLGPRGRALARSRALKALYPRSPIPPRQFARVPNPGISNIRPHIPQQQVQPPISGPDMAQSLVPRGRALVVQQVASTSKEEAPFPLANPFGCLTMRLRTLCPTPPHSTRKAKFWPTACPSRSAPEVAPLLPPHIPSPSTQSFPVPLANSFECLIKALRTSCSTPPSTHGGTTSGPRRALAVGPPKSSPSSFERGRAQL